jgi:multidrug efflux pump subunit AcrB
MTKGFKERQKEEKWPLPFELYKGIKGNHGALRICLKRPYSDQEQDGDKKEKLDGVVFLETSPAIGPNQYDWQNSKTQMALGVNDLAKIIYFFKNPGKFVDANDPDVAKLSIYHDPGAGTANVKKKVKYLNISKKKEMNNFMLSTTTKIGDQNINASIPVSQEEALCITILLEAAIPAILCWTSIGLEPLED